MLNWRYGRLLWRYLWRRLLTASGRRWKTDGFVFFGRALEIEIAARGRVEFGRFVWIGDRTKIRCHEGLVEIGPKTVMGQECTITAYQHIRIGEQCVIADKAMFIDFDHGVVEVERPIRQQGIYKRDVEIGSKVWIGYRGRVLRMREAPERLRWERPVEPDPEAETTLQPPRADDPVSPEEEPLA